MGTYNSYLMRCWRREELGGELVTVEHIQSADRLRNATLDEAVQWIRERNGRCEGRAGEAAEEADA